MSTRVDVAGAHGFRVADAMILQPRLHAVGVTVGELRELFRDDHVQLALLVAGDRLVTTVQREDIGGQDPSELPARIRGALAGRTIAPGERLLEAVARMRGEACRRFAVVDAQGRLHGLLCLKANGQGFCSERDVRSRRADRQA